MGDRVLFQVVQDGKCSPVAYGHWSGSAAHAICQRLVDRMRTRPMDMDYTFARLVQEMTNGDDGNTGFGCWNALAVLTAEKSHGDAGIVIIDVSKEQPTFTCLGGYLVVKDGFPVSKYDIEEP